MVMLTTPGSGGMLASARSSGSAPASASPIWRSSLAGPPSPDRALRRHSSDPLSFASCSAASAAFAGGVTGVYGVGAGPDGEVAGGLPQFADASVMPPSPLR